MLIINVLLLAVTISSLGLGLFIYLKDKKNPINIFYGLFSFGLALWSFGMYMYAKDPIDFSRIILWSKILHFAGSFIATFLLYFGFVFPSGKFFLSKPVTFLIILPLLALFPITIFTDSLIAGLNIQPSNRQLLYGPSYPLFFIHFTGYMSAALIILAKKFFKARGIERKQLKYVVFGILFPSIFAFVINMILPAMGNFRIAWIGPEVIFIIIASIAYAITIHHLFDIRVILTEVATIIVSFALLVEVIISKSFAEGILRFLFLLLISYGGYLLILSVRREIERRREVTSLARQLQIANKHLKALDQLKSEFISIASHDLLTPVAAIEGYMSMVLDEKLVKVKNQKLKEILERIYGSSKRLTRLITDLLNISRIEEGRLLITRIPTDIEKLTQEVIDELKIEAKRKKLTLLFQKPKRKIPQVFIDPDKIHEVLVNIIGNAIRYTLRGGIKVNIEIMPTDRVEKRVESLETKIKEVVEAREEILPTLITPKSKDLVGKNQVVVNVSDTGIGIAKKDFPSLFQKFYQAKGLLPKKAGGSGLGLYISKSLVEMQNGRIWVDSKPEVGSTFSFSLPSVDYIKILKKEEEKIAKTDLKPLAKGPREI